MNIMEFNFKNPVVYISHKYLLIFRSPAERKPNEIFAMSLSDTAVPIDNTEKLFNLPGEIISTVTVICLSAIDKYLNQLIEGKL
jgi:hypothetical protein